MADQTFYVRRSEIEKTGLPNPAKDERRPYSADTPFVLRNDRASTLQRGLVCGCYADEYWSVTARTTGHAAADMDRTFLVAQRPRFISTKTNSLENWPGGKKDEYAAQNACLIDCVWQRIRKGRGREPRSGLIVIAGTTGTGKTTYARELALRCVAPHIRGLGSRDRPHVVTYEDPIESWFAYSPASANESGFDYTPREKGKDVSCLEDAVEDALRQKPTLLYVGEVRSDSDWRTLLGFAGTGHLVLTTTHAGSLAKTFERILKAMLATTAADRSDVGRRVVAILHMREIAKQRVPALWVQTPRSHTALTQEGLASLLPTGDEDGRYGREYFARNLRHLRPVRELALQSDLRGE